MTNEILDLETIEQKTAFLSNFANVAAQKKGVELKAPASFDATGAGVLTIHTMAPVNSQKDLADELRRAFGRSASIMHNLTSIRINGHDIGDMTTTVISYIQAPEK